MAILFCLSYVVLCICPVFIICFIFIYICNFLRQKCLLNHLRTLRTIYKPFMNIYTCKNVISAAKFLNVCIQKCLKNKVFWHLCFKVVLFDIDLPTLILYFTHNQVQLFNQKHISVDIVSAFGVRLQIICFTCNVCVGCLYWTSGCRYNCQMLCRGTMLMEVFGLKAERSPSNGGDGAWGKKPHLCSAPTTVLSPTFVFCWCCCYLFILL